MFVYDRFGVRFTARAFALVSDSGCYAVSLSGAQSRRQEDRKERAPERPFQVGMREKKEGQKACRGTARTPPTG